MVQFICRVLTVASLVSCLFSTKNTIAQSTITGTLIDSESKEVLIGAYIKCTYIVDSTAHYGMSDYDGQFSVEVVEEGEHVVEITYIGYESSLKVITVHEDLDMGSIGLKFSSTALKEIEVTAVQERVSQMGDTTQYNAAAYGANPDASTEDLLQKMPGFVVSDGKMQVQGENIAKILVNGKPFFGDDPEMALKNLPAEIIDKIQVFNPSSEEEEGEDSAGGDGPKTINIVLKDEYNNGVFGDFYGGYGYEDRYKAGGNVSFLKNNRRINLLGQFNNINQQNFSSADLLGVSASRGTGKNKQRGVSNNNFLIPRKGGINTTNATGINYQDEWGKQIEVSGSYFFNQSENTNETSLMTTYFDTELPSYDEISRDNSSNLNHRLRSQLRYRINEKNTLTIKPALTIQQNKGTSESTTDVLSQNTVSNTLSDVLQSDLSALDFSNRLTYKYQFEKKKRSINFGFKNRLQTSSGDQIAQSNSMDSLILHQNSILDNNKQSYSASLKFTEPISKKATIALNYVIENEQNEAAISTYSFSENRDEFDISEENLSSQFNNEYLAHRGELIYNYKKRKTRFTVRGAYQTATLDNQQSFPEAASTQQVYHNFLPFVFLRRNISKNKNLRLSYRTRINLPKAKDLQDVIDNSNPLRIQAGNPNLNQQVNHTFDIKYSSNHSEKGRVFFISLKSILLSDYIGRSTFIASEQDTIDSIELRKGAQLRMPVNLSGYHFNHLFMTYGLPLKALKSNLNFNFSASYKHTPSQINGETLFTNTQNLTTGLVLSSNISENIDFILKTTSTLNFAQNTNLRKTKIFNQRTTAKLNYIFAESWQINSSLTHRYYAAFGDESLDDFILWNMGIGYKFLQNKRAELRLALYDILNSNTAIQQNYGEAFLTQKESLALQRFFMLTFRYKIRGFG